MIINALHPDLKAEVIHHATKDFAASNAIMSHCISTSISLQWNEKQIKEKGEKIVNVIKKVLSEQKVTA